MMYQKFTRIIFVLFFVAFAMVQSHAADAFKPTDVLSTQYCTSADISPDGAWIAYTVRVPRLATEKPGGAYSELYLISVKTGEILPYITGKVSIRQVQWHPAGNPPLWGLVSFV
jgi:hypothetical protein